MRRISPILAGGVVGSVCTLAGVWTAAAYQGNWTAAGTLLNLLLTVVIASATVAYAGLTLVLVRETRSMRQAETEPALAVYLMPHTGYRVVFELVVRNLGRAAAREVSWEVEADEEDLRAHGVEGLSVFKGLSYLPPGEQVRLFFGTSPQLLKDPPLKPITLKARYKTDQGEERAPMFRLEVYQYYGMQTIGKPPEYEVAEALKKIADDLRPILRGNARLSVATVTEQEVRQELEAQRAQWREMRGRETTKRPGGEGDET
jgi:hypothetical protein